jgi:hypothetical protein
MHLTTVSVLCGGQSRSRYLAWQKPHQFAGFDEVDYVFQIILTATHFGFLVSHILLAFVISLNLFVVYLLGPFVMRSTCRYCHGTRMHIKFPCTECEGKGSTVQRKKVTVPVPAGKKFVMHEWTVLCRYTLNHRTTVLCLVHSLCEVYILHS